MKRQWLLNVVIVALLLALVLVPALFSQQIPNKLPDVEPAKHKTYTESIPASKVSFEMIAIPGGTYLMGSPESEAKRSSDEGPRHPVKVGALWMGKLEVTWDEYDLYWRKNPAAQRDKA